MFAPTMYKLFEVIAISGDTEEEIFELGISKKIKFLVMVPELGACEVPTIALSHFMAGADDYQAELMPEHWSKTPSGPWNIKRDGLRIYADSWDRHWNEWGKTVDDLEARTQPKAATVEAGAVEMPHTERRLATLRSLGGDARWKRRKGVQQWVFTGIKKLVEQEKSEGRKRCDEKTIREDLREAAEAESIAKANGATLQTGGHWKS